MTDIKIDVYDKQSKLIDSHIVNNCNIHYAQKYVYMRMCELVDSYIDSQNIIDVKMSAFTSSDFVYILFDDGNEVFNAYRYVILCVNTV